MFVGCGLGGLVAGLWRAWLFPGQAHFDMKQVAVQTVMCKTGGAGVEEKWGGVKGPQKEEGKGAGGYDFER